ALPPFRVVPPTEVMVSVPVVLSRPAPDSLMMALLVRLMGPGPPDTVPVMLIAPVLPTVTLPPPVSLMLPRVSGLAVLVSLLLPLELLPALRSATVFAPFSGVPPTELVVSALLVLTRPEPDSLMAPLLVRLRAPPLPAETVPVMLIAPVLL